MGNAFVHVHLGLAHVQMLRSTSGTSVCRLYPDGQWDYYRYYTTHFDAAVADLDADRASSLASIFKPADPASAGKPSPNAMVTRKGGRFGAAHRAPPTKPDPALWPAADFDALVRAFEAHGFRPPCAWYLNE